MICCYVLLQDLELADYGKLFCASVGGIDDAEDGEYQEHQRAQADDAADKVQSPGDGKDDPVEDAVNDAPRNAGDKQSQALIGVEAGELGSIRRKHRDKHQRAEVGKDAHRLVIGDVRLI